MLGRSRLRLHPARTGSVRFDAVDFWLIAGCVSVFDCLIECEVVQMDLGISGKRALLCASNAGLGLACAKAVAAEGVDIVINGRRPGKRPLPAEAEVKAMANGKVVAVQADVTTDEGREALLSACPDPDILLNNNAGPPSQSASWRLCGVIGKTPIRPITWPRSFWCMQYCLA